MSMAFTFRNFKASEKLARHENDYTEENRKMRFFTMMMSIRRNFLGKAGEDRCPQRNNDMAPCQTSV